MFTLAISCLTTSNLPWFMDLTPQVPMHCSLQHWALLPSPVTSTTGCCFCFGSVSSFVLKLVLHWSPGVYGYLPTWGAYLSLSYLFAFSYCSRGSQCKNTEVVCHSLLQWPMFCQKSPPWPVRLGWLYTAWFIDLLSKTKLWSMWSDWLVFCDCGCQSVCPLLEIQYSVEGWGCVPSLFFDLRPNYGGGDEDNGNLLQKMPCRPCYSQCPNPAAGHHQPTPPAETPGHPRASLGQSPVGHCSFLLGPGVH